MKLTVFHAGDGDCLLLSSGDGATSPVRHVLIDGGRSGAFADNARARIAAIRDAADQKLDVVCVSHIDEDHIAGILRLVEDEVAWRVFDFRESQGLSPSRPGFPRPPEIGELWHNALFELVGDELEPVVESTVAQTASLLAGASSPALRSVAGKLQDIALGERSSMELSRRLSDRQLGVPRNQPSGGGLMKRGAAGETVDLDSLSIFVLGPSDDDIESLRVRWERFVRDEDTALRKLQAELLEDEERLGTLAASLIVNPMIDAALGDGLSNVTVPNLASIMLLVEENGASVLLTGDGVSSEILEGLEHHGKLAPDGTIHVEVLKVQHHGALANVTDDFVHRVTADHYLFCGNGAHHNPELEVVRAFAEARLGGFQGVAVGPDRPFDFHFTSSPATAGLSEARRDHMQDVVDLVRELQAELPQGQRLRTRFLDRGHFEISL
jgi:hypothetical protein